MGMMWHSDNIALFLCIFTCYYKVRISRYYNDIKIMYDGIIMYDMLMSYTCMVISQNSIIITLCDLKIVMFEICMRRSCVGLQYTVQVDCIHPTLF